LPELQPKVDQLRLHISHNGLIKSKGQTPENRFALIKKRYHKNFEALIFTCSLQ
jgi:hypothetical protein